MAKDRFLNTLFKGIAIIGGAYIVSEIVKSLSKQKTMYSCPNCGYDIEFGQTKCPNCATKLRWNNSKIQNGQY